MRHPLMRWILTQFELELGVFCLYDRFVSYV